MPVDEITKSIALKELNLDSSFKYILFFGQIKKVKKLDILLRSMVDVDSKTKLIVAGKVWKDNFDFYQQIIDEIQTNLAIDVTPAS